MWHAVEKQSISERISTTDDDDKFLANDNDEVDLEELGYDVNDCVGYYMQDDWQPKNEQRLIFQILYLHHS
jgi:hypothetical protein